MCLPGIFPRHGTAQHGTPQLCPAHGGPIPSCCSGDTPVAGTAVGGCRARSVPLQRAGERGLPARRSRSMLARRLSACAWPCGRAHSLSKASLSRKPAACSGGTFPALILFPLFYSNCTCANKALAGAKPRSCGERRELRSLPALLAPRQRPAPSQRDFPSPASSQAAAGLPVGISPTPKLVFAVTCSQREDEMKMPLGFFSGCQVPGLPTATARLVPGLLLACADSGAGSCLPGAGVVGNHVAARAGSRVSG